MELIELINPEDCLDPQILERARASSKAPHTRHFIAKDAHSELAFIALDLVPMVDYLVLYELFVPDSLRGKGIGARALIDVESFARSKGYSKVTLNPAPLVQDRSPTDLIDWYKSRGYLEGDNVANELEKNIHIAASSNTTKCTNCR